jgi:Tfp pilus assembly protein PilF
MKSEAIAYVVAGMAFGTILGWVVGTQQVRRPPAAAETSAASPQPAGAGGSATRQPPTLDQARVQELQQALASNPKNVDAVVQLGNTYFDAEQWDNAITWYKRAVELDPKNADASTDLGVSLYYSNRPDEALAQFERSLKISPTHTKTLLNKGIVLAFGKQDLRGAQAEWEKVVSLAPNSPEGQAAKRALEGIASAHANSTPTSNQ